MKITRLPYLCILFVPGRALTLAIEICSLTPHTVVRYIFSQNIQLISPPGMPLYKVLRRWIQ